MKAEPKDSYTPQGLADFWGCSRETILRLVRRGELTGIWISPQNLRITKVDAGLYYARKSVNLSPVVAGERKGKLAGRPWGS